MSSSPTSSSSTERAAASAAAPGAVAVGPGPKAVAVLEAPDPLQPLHDIRCQVDLVIGTGVMTLRECLTLERLHVIKLAEPAGGDLSVRVQGITVGAGEVVVVDNVAALRVTHIAPPAGADLS